MIVRDEAEMLPDCLASVRGLVDEIVIVDTGSTDGTDTLAREAGAKVIDFPWTDDFADARNAALPHATGDWVLHLDADERIAPGFRSALREATAQRSFDCGFLPLHDASRLDASVEDVLSGKARKGEPILLPRLLRRTPDLRWEGAIHESVGGWLTDGGRQGLQVQVPIVHLGNVDTLREDRSKAKRNLDLLERRSLKEPDNPVIRGYLARELLRVGERDRAIQELEVGWKDLVLARSQPSEGPPPSAIALASLRAFLALQDGRFEVVIETGDACERWGLDHPNPLGMRGMARRKQAQAHAVKATELRVGARSDLTHCLAQSGALFSEEVMPGMTGWVAATELGLLELEAGEPTAALAAFEAALSERPEHRDALFGRAEALLDCEKPGEALSALERLLPDGGSDEWALGAVICLALGQKADAVLFHRKALELGKPGAKHPHRRKRFAQVAAELN